MKDLGKLKFSLGIEFARSKKGIVMSQRKYALELVAEMGLSGTKPFIKPLETNLKLYLLTMIPSLIILLQIMMINFLLILESIKG